MLVLSRRRNESIFIGTPDEPCQLKIKVLAVGQNTVRLGFEVSQESSSNPHPSHSILINREERLTPSPERRPNP